MTSRKKLRPRYTKSLLSPSYGIFQRQPLPPLSLVTNPQMTRQCLNLDAQHSTTLSSLSSTTTTTSITMSSNGVTTQSPSVVSGRFGLAYPASTEDLGILSSLSPQSNVSLMTSSPSPTTDSTTSDVSSSFPLHPGMLSTTAPSSVSHNALLACHLLVTIQAAWG